MKNKRIGNMEYGNIGERKSLHWYHNQNKRKNYLFLTKNAIKLGEKIMRNENDQFTYLFFDFTFIKHCWIIPSTETIWKIIIANEILVKRRVGVL